LHGDGERIFFTRLEMTPIGDASSLLVFSFASNVLLVLLSLCPSLVVSLVVLSPPARKKFYLINISPVYINMALVVSCLL